MKKHIFFLAILAVIFFSCKGDGSSIDAFFSSELKQDTVVFINLSEGSTAYSWDFGDNTKSTEKDPTHIYSASGTYLVTLTLNGKVTYSEAVTVAKPLIKVDGDLSDWNSVPAEHIFTSTVPETAPYKDIKTFNVTFDDNYLYFYVKMDKANVGAIDIFINTDNLTTTGNNSWLWGGACGADYMLDGTISSNLEDVAVYYFPASTTDQTAWAWENTVPAGSNVVTISKPKIISGTIIEFEGKIVKELVTSQWADKIGIGFMAQTPSWNIAGCLPGGGANGANLLEVKLK